jgi:outer membrane protein assembly factor BamE (lipoprotein component of BamABCDE complex)
MLAVKQGWLSWKSSPSGCRRWCMAAVLLTALASTACDPQRIAELEEGVATEGDVRAKFGEPSAVYNEEGGARTFEYTRQPQGHRNYMITIGSDGKMTALRQVLKADNFAKVTPDLDKSQVRRLLGQPAKTTIYPLKPNEEHWDWRYMDGTQSRWFTVTFDANGRVQGTTSTLDEAEGGK